MTPRNNDAVGPDGDSSASAREIVLEQMYDAPRALVFAAWTQPEHVIQWWDPSGVPLAACEIDLRPGGTFRFVHATSAASGAAGEGGPAAAPRVFGGTYHEVDPPARLVFTTRAPSGADSVGTLVFDDRDGRTAFTLTITCPTVADREAMRRMGVDAGTARTLNNLGAYLANIRTMRAGHQAGPA